MRATGTHFGCISLPRLSGCSSLRRCSSAPAAEFLPSAQNCTTPTINDASSVTEAPQPAQNQLRRKEPMQTTEKISPRESSRKADPEDYDLVILGGGTGSTVAAWTFAAEGKRVAVIDRKYIGGSCPNIACLPSKNIIHSAKVASYFRRSEEFGIAKRDFTVDMSAVRDRKRRMVSSWNNVYLDNYQKNGAEFILG